jgi:hypothetical protein
MMWEGLALGLFSLFAIGMGFIWVIRGEYYLGYLWWPYPLGLGALLVLSSLLVPDAGIAALMGIAGGSLIWGATEMKEQAVRAELGWFKYNPNRKPDPPGVRWIKRIKAPHL